MYTQSYIQLIERGLWFLKSFVQIFIDIKLFLSGDLSTIMLENSVYTL